MDMPPEELPDRKPDTAAWKRDLLIDCLYAVAIGINVVVIADAATDGALSRAIGQRLFLLKNEGLAWLSQQREWNRDRWEMFMQAYETVGETADDND